MRRGIRSRFAGVLLATLFLGGVGGTADVDAMLFHAGRPVVLLVGPHYEPAGAPDHHADHCLLTLRVAGGRGAPPPHRLVPFEASPTHAAAVRPAAAPQRFFPGLHQDSRAPPAALA